MNNFSKSIGLFTLFSTIVSLSYSNTAHADIQGIPYNADFPKAQYPYAQAPDGCSGIKSTKEVRDTWGPVDFSGACNTHDKCYYTVDSKWNTCNERFYSDLRAACERDLKVSFRVLAPTLTDPRRTRRVDGPPDPIRLTTCYKIATAYYTGVQAGVAFDVFKDAQKLQKRYEEWVTSYRPAQSDVASKNKQKFRSGGTISTDFDGDGKADRYKKTDDGRLLIDYAKNGFGKWDESYKDYGGPGAQLVPADYDGDGKADISVKLDSGEWLIDYAKNGFGKWDETL